MQPSREVASRLVSTTTTVRVAHPVMHARQRLWRLALVAIAVASTALPLTQSAAVPVQAASYSATVLGDSPSAYYRLGESSGTTATDSSGNGHNATYSGSETLGVAGALPGDSDTAVSVSGATIAQYLAGSGLPVGNSPRTVELWIKTSVGNSSQMDLVSWGSPNFAQGYGVQLEKSNYIQLGGWTAVNQYFTTPRPITDNTWHMLDAEYDGNRSMILYVDGQLVGSQQTDAALNTTIDPTIGLALGNGLRRSDAYTGSMDEVVIYPTALSAAQVAAHFNASGNSRPSAPGTVSAAAGSNQATVTWTQAQPGSTPITSYVVTAYSGVLPVQAIATAATATSATLSGLPGGVAYTFTVAGINSFGTGATATTSAATPTGAASTHAASVTAAIPSVYYRLGEQSGSTGADSSGGGHLLTYGSGVTLGAAGAISGDPDTAVSVASGTVGVNLAGSGVPIGNASRTVEVWIRTSATVPSSGEDLVTWGSPSTAEGFQVQLENATQVQVAGWTSINPVFTAPHSLIDNTWHLLDAEYDGHSMMLYVDGALVGSQAIDRELNTTLDPTIGLALGNGLRRGTPYTGSMDDVAIFPSALSAAQVADHWSLSAVSVPGPPRAVQAFAETGALRVSWQPPASTGGVTLTNYSVTPVVGGVAQPSTQVDPSLTSVDLPGLTPGQSTTVAVAANNGVRQGAAASTASVTPSQPLAATGAPSLSVYAGYSGGQEPKPWSGAAEVGFVGIASTEDSSALLFTNSSGSPITLDDVSVDIASTHIDLWGTGMVVPAQGGLVLATTGPGTAPMDTNFDGTDVSGQSSDCSPPAGRIPQVHVGIAATTTTYQDTGQVLIGGKCLPGDEATPWQQIGGTPGGLESLGYNPGEMQCHCHDADPVDTATGNYAVSFTDISIPGRGVPLLFAHSYNSAAAGNDGPLGYGWTPSYNMFLTAGTGLGAGVVTVHQENGSTVPFTRVGSGYVAPTRVFAILVQNPDGTFTYTRRAQQKFTFSSAGQLVAETDLNGYATSLAYDSTSGLLSSVTDPAGRQLTLAYSGAHLTGITDVAGSRSVIFAYNDGQGNLTDVTNVNGGVWHFTYDSHHLLLTERDPRLSTVLTNVYDTAGRVTQQTDALQRVTTFAYTPTATAVTDPKGNVVVHTYQDGVIASETRGAGTLQAATWQYQHDPATLGLTQVTDPNGHITTMTYDANGNLLTQTLASGVLNRTTTYTYNALDEPLTVMDPNGVTTTLTYDTHGNLLSRSTPLVGANQNQAVTYTYGDSTHPGDVTAVTDPDSKVSHTSYDTYGNVASTTDPLGDLTTMTYNTVGWLLTTVSPRGNVSGCGCASQYTTTYSYVDPITQATDEFGDVRVITDPLGNRTVKSYDAVRNLISATDPDGNVTQYTFDLANQQTDVTRADSTRLHTDYYADGSVQDQVNGANDTTNYAYDPLGDLTSTTDPLSNVTSYANDALGNVLTKTDPGGSCTATPKVGCTTYAYDAANQLSSITYSDGVTPNVTGLTYDADGQRTAMTDGTGTSSWTWDSLHRMTSYTNGNGAAVHFGYNLRSLQTTITYPGSLTVTQGFDDAGRLTSVQDWLSNNTTFAYDSNSNLTTETLPSASGVIDTFTFDAADRLSNVSDAQGSTNLFAATYTHDANGQVTGDTSATSNQSSYRYTALNQVCYAGSSNSTACPSPPTASQPFTYDAADNLTQIGSTQQSFNAAGELCWTALTTGNCSSPPVGATTYTYDARGNRTQVAQAGVGTTTLSYDQANRLIAYGSAAYAYNGDGLRMSRTLAGAATTQEVWNVSTGLPLLLQDGSTNYIYGPGSLPLEQITGSAVLSFHHDQLGSTRLLTTATGTPTATYTYDPYGNLTASTGTVANPFLYAGQYRDAESSLYYLRARYYDTSTGQFLSHDPLASMTRSPYGYVGDDPLNFADPTGLDQNCDVIPRPWDMGNSCMAEAVGETTTGKVVLAGGGIAATGGVACLAGGCEALAALGAGGLATTAANQVAPIVENEGPSTVGVIVSDEAACESAGLMRQLMMHVQRLNDYMGNPLDYDNKGFLSQAINYGTTDPNALYESRIQSLLGQMAEFKRQIEENAGG